MPQGLTQDKVGLTVYGDYAQTTAGAAIDELVALLTPDATSTQRGFLDEMSPAAQVQLLKELEAMKAVVTLFAAP